MKKTTIAKGILFLLAVLAAGPVPAAWAAEAAGISAEEANAGQATGSGIVTETQTAALGGSADVRTSKKKKAAHWYVSKHQRWYYFLANGKRARGLVKIGNRKYYFDKKGIQCCGWQKIGKNYYYFRIRNGAQGYMVRGENVNGIHLKKKSGKASLTSYAKKKLRALTAAQKIVRSVAAPGAKRLEKLRASFRYLISHYQYRGALTFYQTKNWDIDYALQVFEDGHGNCYAFGAAMAYLGNACGYSSAAISSGGHGWAEINGYVSDPTWEMTDESHDYFLVKYSLSGVDGRPDYRRGRIYVRKI